MRMHMDEKQFDRVADDELHHIDRVLGETDPDELEVELSAGVLTLVLRGKDTIVINSHRAAGQIWMAAYRRAWHFDPIDEAGVLRWRTQTDELRGTLGRILSEKLGRDVAV